MSLANFNKLIEACKNGNLANATQAITDGADINMETPEGQTPLFIAVTNQHQQIVEYLITNGADVNLKTKHGYTPLLRAAEKGNVSIVEYLLSKGAAIDETNGFECTTALHAACIDFFGLNVVKVLVDAGANVNLKNKYGQSPLFKAASYTRLDIVRYLLSNGASVNEKNGKDELTALYMACYNGDLDIVKVLVDAGADINLKSARGLSPLDAAIHGDLGRKHWDIVKYLSSKDAEDANKYNIQTNLKLNNYVPPQLNASPSIPFDKFKLEEKEDILIMTIPKGTLLYNSHTVDKPLSETNTTKMYGGTLPMSTSVKVEGDELVIESCIDQFSNKFFYSNPVGGPALGGIASDFNVCNVFETKREMRFAVLMTPSHFHRQLGDHPHKLKCSELPADVCECTSIETENNNGNNNDYNNSNNNGKNSWNSGKNSWNSNGSNKGGARKRTFRKQSGGKLRCPYAFHYDVCLKPEFLQRLQLDGHIAIASKDSYDERMKSYETRILYDTNYDKEYKKLTRILFNGGLSADDRSEYGKPEYTGLPELVIQIFGTDWYGPQKSKRSTYRIPLPPGHTPESRIKILSKFLLDYNYDVLPDIEFKTPLRLLGISTAFHGYFDLVNGGNKALGFPTASAIDTFYLQFLKNYLDGSLRFYFDTRNGFLIRETAPIYVRMSDGSEKSFLELCKMGGESATGKTALEITAAARRAGGGPWAATDCLVPAVKKQVAGRRRSRRMMANNGTRKHKLNMLTGPLGTPAALKARNMPLKAPNKTRRRARAPPTKLRPHELSAGAINILHIMLEVVRENQEIIQSYK